MVTLLSIIGLFFLLGWAVAIVYAIRADLKDYRERKVGRMQSRA